MKELQNENGERDSSLCVVIKERGEDPKHTPCLPSNLLHPEQQEKERRQRTRTRRECLVGCTRLSHSETQGEAEPCLCGEAQPSAARLPRLCEESTIGLLLGILNKEKKKKKKKEQGRQPAISCHAREQEEGGGSLKSWTR